MAKDLTNNSEKDREEFMKDLDVRRPYHRKMNYLYLSYKGISLLNSVYSQEILESLGLQIHVPRTFMTIESIRPDLDRPIDITVKWRNRKERHQAEKVQQMLKGEWARSKADRQKAKADFDALLYGSGYLLNYFDLDEEKTDVFKGYDKEGKPLFEKGMQKNYEGMKIKWLNPYYVIPDRKAKTYEPKQHDSPRHIWVVSIWDYDSWLEECKKKGYTTEGLSKGGLVEEYDRVKRTIDAIFSRTLTDLKTRDNGILPSYQTELPTSTIDENAIAVYTKYTADGVKIYAGANWTLCHDGINFLPKKEIPIYVIKDTDVPGELEGIGEAEIIRWQQYEENKIHNLMYLQVILNTVKRYGIVEEMLADPTQARMTNPLQPIRLKYFAGVKVNDAIQQLNQSSATDVPLNVLEEVKTIGQMATGQTDYAIGANQGEAGTLGEAEMMNQAGNKRTKKKIETGEENGIAPILESWLSAIPQLYNEELDYLLNDGTNKEIKFLPFNREFNTNAKIVAEYAVREGALSPDVKTLEDVFKSQGYAQVVFVSDLIGGYDISIKTSLAFLDRSNTITQYQQAIGIAMAENKNRMDAGLPPTWDTGKLTEDLLRQFNDIIDDVTEYRLPIPQVQGMPGTNPTGETLSNSPAQPNQPVEQSANQIVPANNQPANLNQ